LIALALSSAAVAWALSPLEQPGDATAIKVAKARKEYRVELVIPMSRIDV
jgi:hypothetical protein